MRVCGLSSVQISALSVQSPSSVKGWHWISSGAASTVLCVVIA